MKLFRKRRRLWLLLAAVPLAALLAVPAGSIYYTAAGGKACIRCHEVQSAYDDWLVGAMQSLPRRPVHH